MNSYGFNFAFFSFFLYELFTNQARKLEVAESISIYLSLSLCRLGFLSFPFSFTFYLSLSLSLSLLLYLSRFVDAALQLL